MQASNIYILCGFGISTHTVMYILCTNSTAALKNVVEKHCTVKWKVWFVTLDDGDDIYSAAS